MSKGWKLLRAGLAAIAVATLCSGCAETFKAVRYGQPDMGNIELFNRDQALGGPRVDTNGTPLDCKLQNKETTTDSAYIKRCTEAVRYLIDKAWTAYQHDVFQLDTGGNFLADATVMGLSTSIPLVAPGTKNVLAAIISGINGLKTNANEDLLFKNSIQLIILQMQKDRNSWLAVIENNLNTNHYQSMTEASTDLYAYFVAGTWDHAMISMQTDAGAQNASCEAAVKNIKSNTGTEGTSTATTQCNTNASSATSVPSPIYVPFAEGSRDLADAANVDGRNAVQSAIDKYNAAKAIGVNLQFTLQGMTDTKPGENAAIANDRATSVQKMLTTSLKIGADVVPISGNPDLKSKPGVTINFSMTTKVANNGPLVNQQGGDNAGHPANSTPTPVVSAAPTTTFTQADLKPNAIFTNKDGATVVITGIADPDGDITFVGPDAGGTLKPGNEPVTTLFSTLETLVKAGHS